MPRDAGSRAAGPDFVVSGVPKAGTTALWHWLARHPQVFLPPVKEPGFFAFEGRDPHPAAGPFDPAYCSQIVTDRVAYAALFDGAGSRLRGEASPIYALDPQAPARMAARRPDLKVVLILRAPVARAFSQFAHHRRDGLEPLGDFAAALAAEETRRRAGWSPFHGYAMGGHYRPILQRFEAVFPAGNLLVLFHDDMEHDPERLWRRLCRFLGLAEAPLEVPRRRENTASATATGARNAALRRVLRHPGPMLSGAAGLLPGPVRHGLKRGLERLNASAGPRLEPAVAIALARRYDEDIDWLERRFGRNLSHWRL